MMMTCACMCNINSSYNQKQYEVYNFENWYGSHEHAFLAIIRGSSIFVAVEPGQLVFDL